jgi:signal transduction histidine kinase/CheY-like chemotaxis protein
MSPSTAKATARSSVRTGEAAGGGARDEHRARALLGAVTTAQRRMLSEDDGDAVLGDLLSGVARALGAAGGLLGTPNQSGASCLRLVTSPGLPEGFESEVRTHLLRAWRENADILVDGPAVASGAASALPVLVMPFREGARTLGVASLCGFAPGDAAMIQEELAALSGTFASLTVAQRARTRPRLDIDRISQLLAIVSHELRTPLNAVLGAVELLGESRLDDEQSRHLSLCRHAGANMLALVDDLVELSMAEAGLVKLESAPFDVRELVSSVLGNILADAEKKDIDVLWHVGPAVPRVLVGDAVRLRQVLSNLLSNAVKFTPRGSIRVEVEPAQGVERSSALLFSVKDTGIGIPLKNLESVFDRFSQVDVSNTRAHGGTGLGLAICRHLVGLMDGRIWAESEMGVGTTVHFTAHFSPAGTLPARPSVAPGPRRTPSGEHAAAAARSLSILLAEDHPDNRLIVTSFLKNVPHRMTIAENGEAALAAFKEGTFDIVLMDIQMPVLDGYAATRRIRAFESEQKRPRTAVVALTAHVLAEEIARAHAAGCDGHLGKPISKAALLAALERHAAPAGSGEEDLLAKVDPDLMDLIPGYVQNRFRDVEACRARLQGARFEEIRILAHGMAGSGGAYGFDEITRIGRAMELAARAGDGAACAKAIDELDGYVRRVHAACAQ